jgi:hypothetical protein
MRLNIYKSESRLVLYAPVWGRTFVFGPTANGSILRIGHYRESVPTFTCDHLGFRLGWSLR